MRELEDFNYYTTTPDYTCIISFNQKTYVDNTSWTVRSHFAVMTVCFLCAIKLCIFPRHNKISSGCVRKQLLEQLVPLYLLLTSMSHGFASIHHSIVVSAQNANPLETISQTLGILACMILFLFSLTMVEATQNKKSIFVKAIWVSGISGLAIVAAGATVFYWKRKSSEGGNVLVGIDLHVYFTVGVYLLLLLAYAIRIIDVPDGKICHFFQKALALLIIILAAAYAYHVYRKCGSYDPGYLECFVRCPLPGGLNHTSFYNFAKLWGLGGWALAEDGTPSVCLQSNSTLHIHMDDATVISEGPELFASDMDKDELSTDRNKESSVFQQDTEYGLHRAVEVDVESQHSV